MSGYLHPLLTLCLLLGSYRACLSQEAAPPAPQPGVAKQAFTLDVGGNAPFIGISNRHQLIQFKNAQRPYAGALEGSVGIGYFPSICIFGCSEDGLTTYHSLLLLWGHKLQAELGYSGTLAKRGLLVSRTGYLPAAVGGLRYAPQTWLMRLYLAGVIYTERGTGVTPTGDLVWQKTTYLQFIPGLSVGKRF